MRLANMNLLLFVGNHCQRESTLTIVSSECSRPLSGVTLYSRSYMVVVSSSNGRFRIRACRLPLYVTLKKYGYRTMRVVVRRSTETFKMRCLGMFYHRTIASCCCRTGSFRPFTPSTQNRQNRNQVRWNNCAGVLRNSPCRQKNSLVTCSKSRWRSTVYTVLRYISVFSDRF